MNYLKDTDDYFVEIPYSKLEHERETALYKGVLIGSCIGILGVIFAIWIW